MHVMTRSGGNGLKKGRPGGEGWPGREIRKLDGKGVVEGILLGQARMVLEA